MHTKRSAKVRQPTACLLCQHAHAVRALPGSHQVCRQQIHCPLDTNLHLSMPAPQLEQCTATPGSTRSLQQRGPRAVQADNRAVSTLAGSTATTRNSSGAVPMGPLTGLSPGTAMHGSSLQGKTCTSTGQRGSGESKRALQTCATRCCSWWPRLAGCWSLTSCPTTFGAPTTLGCAPRCCPCFGILQGHMHQNCWSITAAYYLECACAA